MSISPTDANSPASSTRSSSALANPNHRHGSHSRRRGHHPRRPAGSTSGDRQIEVPPSGSDGPAVVIPGDSYEPTSNLTGLRTGVIEGCSQGPINGTDGHDHVFNGKGAASGKEQKTLSLHGGKRTGGFSSSCSHRQSAGINSLHGNATSLHGNATQTGARRSQMVSANHLLNFHYDPIPRPQPRLPPPRRPQRIRPFNRDLFLQANYRFVILDTENHHIESMDPDKMIDWDNIVYVSYSTPLAVQCPICLESPLCPQITSCGHIFCFPCILRYLLMGEEDHRGECWKKCPLCFNTVSSKDLYTISIDHVKNYEVGEDIKFSLLTRRKNSFVPFRKKVGGEEAASSSLDLFDSFSKFILTSDVELSVREARSSLDEWLARADAGLVDDLERLPYVCAALEHLEQRMKAWAGRQSLCSPIDSVDLKGNKPLTNISHRTMQSSNKGALRSWKCQDESLILEEKAELDGRNCSMAKEIDERQDATNADFLKEPAVKITVAPSSPTEDKLQGSFNGGKDIVDDDGYIFYQVADGQHIILHPLNMKCLLHHYKSADLLPQEIVGKILQLETVTQSEAMRRRFRFLGHFPLTTVFQFCEIDLREMLPSEAFAPCIEEIKKRERQRKHVARKERQAKAMVQENVVANSKSYIRVPGNDALFSPDDFEALGNSAAQATSLPVAGERKLFSDVTRLGFAAAHDSPSLRTDDPPVDPSAIAATGPGISALSFSSIITSTKPVEIPEPRLNAFGKKGKKPTRVLLSTTGGRRY